MALNKVLLLKMESEEGSTKLAFETNAEVVKVSVVDDSGRELLLALSDVASDVDGIWKSFVVAGATSKDVRLMRLAGVVPRLRHMDTNSH